MGASMQVRIARKSRDDADGVRWEYVLQDETRRVRTVWVEWERAPVSQPLLVADLEDRDVREDLALRAAAKSAAERVWVRPEADGFAYSADRGHWMRLD
jgi:hypothetical protein